MTQSLRQKKTIFSWVLAIIMIFSIMAPGSTSVVNAAKEFDGYVYVTVEKFTLGQGLAAAPKKIGYRNGDSVETILKRGYGDDKIIVSQGQWGASFDGFVDGGEPEGWTVDDIPAKILEALEKGAEGDYAPPAVNKTKIAGRTQAGVLANYDYTGQSYLMLCVDNMSALYGISSLKNGDAADGSAYHAGSVIRVEYGIYNYGADLNVAYGTPLIDFPDKDELIREIVNYTGDKNKDCYKDAVSVLEDWDATATEVAAAEKKLEDINKTSKDKYESIYKEALDNINNNMVSPAYGNEWTVLSIARNNLSDEKWDYQYIKSVNDKIDELKSDKLNDKQSTDNAKIILILNSVGGDPEHVGDYNLVAPLADYDYVKKQGVNGIIYSLLALDSKDYEIPELKGQGVQNTRELMIKGILDAQIASGGWDWSAQADTLDPDLSGMALQALAPYYTKDESVKKAVDSVVDLLAKKQDDNGGYSSWGYANSCSCAQVLCALSTLGIDADKDERFIKNGNSLLDATISYYDNVSKTFKNYPADSEGSAYANDQVMYALTAYDRMINGAGNLYDLSEVCKHTYKVINKKEATCKETGYTGDIICEDSADVIEKGTEIARKAHTPVEIPAVAATETTEGKTAGKKCSVCGEILEAQKDVPATGKKEEPKKEEPVKTEEKKESVSQEYNITSVNGSETTVEFKNTDKDSKSVTIQNTTMGDNGNVYKVTKVADNAFADNKNITSVTMGANVTEIGTGAFKNCTKLSDIIIQDGSITKIDADAFAGAAALKTIDLSECKLVSIDTNAFANCKKLATVKIDGNKLTKVGKNAFRNIKKNAKIMIFAKNKKTYKKVVKMIKKSGAKKVKYSFKKKK